MNTKKLEFEKDSKLYIELKEAERQIKNGKIIPHEEAKKRIKENLEKWK